MTKHDNSKPVTASELSQMGVCERLVRYEHQHGKLATRSQKQHRDRGNAAHRQFMEDALRSQRADSRTDAKPWCWIASAVYGPEAKETHVLRRFRDLVLRKLAIGRLAIAFYYRHSSVLARLISRSDAARLAARVLLTPAVFLAKFTLANRDRRHTR